MDRQAEKRALKALGKRITYFREEKGYTKTKLAIEADITREQVLRIEQGTTNPTYITLMKIAFALDVPILTLLDISTSKK